MKKKKKKKNRISTKENSQKNILEIINFKKKPKLSKISIKKAKNESSKGLDRKVSNFNFLSNKIKNKDNSSLLVFSKTKNNEEINQKYSEFELDDLEYLEAIKYDKRTFFQFFLCLVKREHLIVFTFIYCKDLNLLCIKLSLFIFSISLDMTTNMLFFNDDSMHKIYLDYGKYNFVSQIPQIIYSTVISEVFDVFFKFLSLSEKEIYQAKKYDSLNIALIEVRKLISRLKIKFFLFYLINLVLMLFFWYFLSTFCSVYENTQIILFKDSAISLLISLIYPFILYLLPAALRIIALRSKKKDKRFLYKISNIFPLF